MKKLTDVLSMGLYIIKGSRLEEISGKEAEAAMNKFNHRPRKAWDYETLHAVLFNMIELQVAW